MRDRPAQNPPKQSSSGDTEKLDAALSTGLRLRGFGLGDDGAEAVDDGGEDADDGGLRAEAVDGGILLAVDAGRAAEVGEAGVLAKGGTDFRVGVADLRVVAGEDALRAAAGPHVRGVGVGARPSSSSSFSS